MTPRLLKILAGAALVGLALGYVAAKQNVAYKSEGQPIGFYQSTDPTVNFTS